MNRPEANIGSKPGCWFSVMNSNLCQNDTISRSLITANRVHICLKWRTVENSSPKSPSEKSPQPPSLSASSESSSSMLQCRGESQSWSHEQTNTGVKPERWWEHLCQQPATHRRLFHFSSVGLPAERHVMRPVETSEAHRRIIIFSACSAYLEVTCGAFDL